MDTRNPYLASETNEIFESKGREWLDFETKKYSFVILFFVTDDSLRRLSKYNEYCKSNNYVNKNKEKISDIVGTHSELSAVIKLGEEDCSGLTIVNTRINRNNKLDFSAPCNGCSDMIKQLNFKEVWYSNANGLFNKLNLTSIIT